MQLLKKIVLAVLIVFFMSSMKMNAFAVTFTDIDDAPWARNHIERMAEAGIISGSIHPTTGQRVYLPNNPVTKVESIVLLYSALQKTEQLNSATNYSSKYQSMLSTAQIPDWAQKQVSYAMENAIITTGDLSTFMRSGSPDPLQNAASREEVALYFGRALDKENEAGSNPVSLSFTDTENINSAALPYVSYLVANSIVSGDDLNRFNPRASITRAEMAALTSKTYDMLQKEETVVIDLTPVKDTNETNIIERTIEQVNIDTSVIFVADDDDNLEMYRITSNTEIILNMTSGRINDLRKGQTVEMVLNNNGDVVSLEVNPQRNELRVIVRYITDVGDYYVASIENASDKDDQRNFRIHDTTQITLEGKSAGIQNITAGDELLFYHDGINVLRVTDEFAAVSELEGILESLSINRYPFFITIRSVGNQRIEYEIDPDVYVYINNRRSDLSGLVMGDIISLSVQDDLVTEIDAISQERSTTVTGSVKEIVLSRPNRITITDRDNNDITHVLADDVNVYIDDNRAYLSEISVNAYVELTIKNGEVIEIDARRSTGRNIIQGEIIRFYDSINRLLVDYFNPSTNRYEEILVYVNNDTIYIDEQGDSIDFGGLNRNDFILITGVLEDGSFIASRIMILEE